MNTQNDSSALPHAFKSIVPDGYVQLCDYGDVWEHRLSYAFKNKRIRGVKAGNHKRAPLYLHDGDVAAYKRENPLLEPIVVDAVAVETLPATSVGYTDDRIAAIKEKVRELLNVVTSIIEDRSVLVNTAELRETKDDSVFPNELSADSSGPNAVS